MKLFLFVFFLPLVSFSQIADSIQLGKQVKEGILKIDSCEACLSYKIFKVLTSNRYYQINYYNDSIIVEEGLMKKKLSLFNFYKLGTYRYLHDGAWYEYNYKENYIYEYDWSQESYGKEFVDTKIGDPNQKRRSIN